MYQNQYMHLLFFFFFKSCNMTSISWQSQCHHIATCCIFTLIELNWNQFGPRSQHRHPTTIGWISIAEVYFAFFAVGCSLWMTLLFLIESSDRSRPDTYKFATQLCLSWVGNNQHFVATF